MKELIANVRDSLLGEIIIMFIGSVIGYLFLKIKTYHQVSKTKKNIERTQERFVAENIISLDHGDPYYEYSDFVLDVIEPVYFLAIPEKYHKFILSQDPDFKFNEECIFNGTMDLDEYGESIGISNFRTLIDKHIMHAAEDISVRLRNSQILFNGDKFGIRRINGRRVGDAERSGLNIDFYRTDYFTHRVMRSVYKELKEKGHKISQSSNMSDVNRYYPFFTSLGINVLLILEHKGHESIVLSNRRAEINVSGNDLWHVSVNEGLSNMDVNEFGEVDLLRCVTRGLREELGIRNQSFELLNSKNFYDLFLNVDVLEIGLTSMVKTTMSFEAVQNGFASAQDAELESKGLTSVIATKKDVLGLIQTSQCTDACRYALHMYLSRNSMS